MKPAIVFHQDVMFIARTHTDGKGSRHELIGRGIQGRHDPEAAFTRLWTDERVDVEPPVAGMDGADQGLSRRCPHGAENQFQPQTMFVYRPHRHAELLHYGSVLNASLAASSPLTCWGRGRCGEKPAARMNSSVRFRYISLAHWVLIQC